MIVPKNPTDEAAAKDPRAQLIRKLIELKSYKELALDLTPSSPLSRCVWPKYRSWGNWSRSWSWSHVIQPLPTFFKLCFPHSSGKKFMFTKLSRWSSHRELRFKNCGSDEISGASKVHWFAPQVSRPQDVISMFLGVLEMARMQITGIEQNEIWTHRNFPSCKSRTLSKPIDWSKD